MTGCCQEELGGSLALRSAYQRAVVAPVAGTQALWKEYGAWENRVSQPLAKGVLAEFLPQFQAARAVARERSSLWDAIDWSGPSPPPGHSLKVPQSPHCSAPLPASLPPAKFRAGGDRGSSRGRPGRGC